MLHQVAQRLPVLALVVAHADEDVVQRAEPRPRARRGAAVDGARGVEVGDHAVLLVVLPRDVRDGERLELVGVLRQKRVVRLVRVVLDQLGEVVRALRRGDASSGEAKRGGADAIEDVLTKLHLSRYGVRNPERKK